MSPTTALPRQTKYCTEIEKILIASGHATNAQILSAIREIYPGLSATTVHRATTRLARRGTISIAPPTHDGSMQYDSNTTPHDHFQCLTCDLLKDTDVKNRVIPILESSIDNCSISGQLTITGVCKQCLKN